MSLLPCPLAQPWTLPFQIHSSKTTKVFAPIPTGPALEIAILNSFWRKKSMSLLPCSLAQPWKLQFEIHFGEKKYVFAPIPIGTALEIAI